MLHVGEIPPFEPGSWKFVIWGEVENPLELSWEEFLKLPRKVQRSDFHCVTGWSRLGDEWEGVAAGDLVEAARPKDGAKFALVHSLGGYTTSLPLGELTAEDTLLVIRFNGRELTPEHGFPLRLLVPWKYAYKSAKWVRGFKLLSVEELGFWESRGYSNTADPWKEERYS